MVFLVFAILTWKDLLKIYFVSSLLLQVNIFIFWISFEKSTKYFDILRLKNMFKRVSAISEVLYTRYIFLILILSDSQVTNTWLKKNLKYTQGGALYRFFFSEEYNTTMRLDVLFVAHRSWLERTGTRDIGSNLNLRFDKVLLNRGFEPPTLSC